jgi:hypothetical protein
MIEDQLQIKRRVIHKEIRRKVDRFSPSDNVYWWRKRGIRVTSSGAALLSNNVVARWDQELK